MIANLQPYPEYNLLLPSECIGVADALGLGWVFRGHPDADWGIASAETVWQRCRVHFLRNALVKVGAKERAEAGRDLKSIFSSPDKALCLQVAEEVAAKWERRKPRLARQIRAQAEECLTVHELPPAAQRKLHSTNMLERVMREIKRRTDVVGIFPNVESCDRLVGAMLIERHETWECEGKRYIALDGAET